MAIVKGGWVASHSGRFSHGVNVPGTPYARELLGLKIVFDDAERRKILLLPGLTLQNMPIIWSYTKLL
jgi:hypothetical protein